MSHFGDLLAERVQARESQIVLGLDPDPMALWPAALAFSQNLAPASSPEQTAQRAAQAVREHSCALIDAAGPACVAIKGVADTIQA